MSDTYKVKGSVEGIDLPKEIKAESSQDAGSQVESMLPDSKYFKTKVNEETKEVKVLKFLRD